MKTLKNTLLIALVSILASCFALAIACGDDDDDDDSDDDEYSPFHDDDSDSDDDADDDVNDDADDDVDDDADDDDDVAGILADAQEDCVDFYVNACGIDEDTAQLTCELWLENFQTMQDLDAACLAAAFDALWECTDNDCYGWTDCVLDFLDELEACIG
jgi:hypothetical protein